ncbi:hypothetical protein VOLCADRAFT_119430, partial [Volvox carteri f. nagariensis]
MTTDGAATPFLYSVSLNPLDCNLDTILSSDRLSAHTLSEAGCGYCWSGVRANLGIFARGKFFFRVTVGAPRPVNVHNTAALSTAYGIRVGVSRFQTAVEQLGEVPYSWAYCSTGSRASFPGAPTNGSGGDGGGDGGGGYPVFEEAVGPRVVPGDTITLALDLATAPAPGGRQAAAAANTADPAPSAVAEAAAAADANAGEGPQGSLWVAVNGGKLVRLFSLPLPNQPMQAYFPHILLRNLSATADFVGTQSPEPQGTKELQRQRQQQPQPQRHHELPAGLLERGFRPWQEATIVTADCVSTMPPPGQLPPASKCEVLVLTGLPGSGKTTWAARHCAAHPARRYCVLGTQLVLEQMRLSCPRTRRFHYMGKPEEVFALVADTLTRIQARAPATPRNYILDRTHVTSKSRRNAVVPFRAAGFRCASVAVVSTEDKLLAQQKEAFEREGKVVPDEAMAVLRADFTLPNLEEGFDDVQYPLLGVIAALTTVNRQRREARTWLEWRLKVGAKVAGLPGPPPPLPEQQQQQQHVQRQQGEEGQRLQGLQQQQQEMPQRQLDSSGTAEGSGDGTAAVSPIGGTAPVLPSQEAATAAAPAHRTSESGSAAGTVASGLVHNGGGSGGRRGRGEVNRGETMEVSPPPPLPAGPVFPQPPPPLPEEQQLNNADGIEAQASLRGSSPTLPPPPDESPLVPPLPQKQPQMQQWQPQPPSQQHQQFCGAQHQVPATHMQPSTQVSQQHPLVSWDGELWPPRHWQVPQPQQQARGQGMQQQHLLQQSLPAGQLHHPPPSLTSSNSAPLTPQAAPSLPMAPLLVPHQRFQPQQPFPQLGLAPWQPLPQHCGNGGSGAFMPPQHQPQFQPPQLQPTFFGQL